MAAVARIEERRPRPVRTILREFLGKILADAEEVDLAEIILYARRRFENDEEFKQALLDDALGILVADVLQSMIGDARRGNIDAASGRDLIRTEAGFVRRSELDTRAKQLAAKMFESVGEGRRKSFLAMNRPEIRFAIERREKLIGSMSRWNGFAREITAGLRDDAQTVGDRYADDEFDRIWKRHFDLNPNRDQLEI